MDPRAVSRQVLLSAKGCTYIFLYIPPSISQNLDYSLVCQFKASSTKYTQLNTEAQESKLPKEDCDTKQRQYPHYFRHIRDQKASKIY